MWVADAGEWRVTGEGLEGRDCDAFFTAVGARSGRKEWTDYTLSLRLKVLSRGPDWRDGAWIGFRCRDASNAYTLGFYERGAHVHKVAKGRSTGDNNPLAASPSTIKDDTWHDVAVTVVGTRITVALDGKTIIEAKDDGWNGAPAIASGGIVLTARKYGKAKGTTRVVFADVRVQATGAVPAAMAYTMADARKAATGRSTRVSMLEFLKERRQRRYTRVPRKVLAFYYTWYGRPERHGRWVHWGEVKPDEHDISASTHYPARGAYDSHDPEIIDWHIDLAKRHGLDAFITTWWGQGTFDDKALVTLLERAAKKHFEVTIYWETVPGTGRAQIARGVNDLVYVLEKYGSHPAFLKLDGKPVIFVYGRVMGQVGMTEWPEIITLARERYGKDFLLIADGYSEGYARVFDGIHVYNICGALREKPVAAIQEYARQSFPRAVKLAKDHARLSCITIIPGYDDTKIRKPGIDAPRHGGQTYRVLWEQAIAADPDWVLITSWNEWHEGSEIEPSWEDGDKYIKLTGEYAARFKATPFSKAPVPATPPGVSPDKARALRKLYEGRTIGILPDFGGKAVFWLAATGVALRELSWRDVLDPVLFNARQLPVVVYAGAESYVQTVREKGDVDKAILRYLAEGGLLVALPTGPFPFYYNESGEAVVSAGRFGFPIGGSGAFGRADVAPAATVRGWETPPEGVKLAFQLDTERLAGLPKSVPFPDTGDPRWRPCTGAVLPEGDVYLPLARLVDDRGHHYGDGVAYIEHKVSPPRGGKNIYAWKRMADVLAADPFLFAIFRLAAEKAVPER